MATAQLQEIRNLADLCAYIGTDRPDDLNRRIYKDTNCGASISLYFDWREALHYGAPGWDAITTNTRGVIGFTIQTIVEGSDATVDSDLFRFPVAAQDVDRWVDYMEAEAVSLWKANEDD